MSNFLKKEFGDYQTPISFCRKVVNYLTKKNYARNSQAIFDPTCGVGNFLSAASEIYRCNNVYGVEINPSYSREAKHAISKSKIFVGNIFDTVINHIFPEKEVLIIGNPPWATNASLMLNLPRKTNERRLRGIEAITGESNFDICENIILRMVQEFKNTKSVIAMLCKTSVARKVILAASKDKVHIKRAEMVLFDSKKVFNVSASACLLILEFSQEKVNSGEVKCKISNFNEKGCKQFLVAKHGSFEVVDREIDGISRIKWRHGIKHDCSEIMELNLSGNKFVNKMGENALLEKDLIYPLLKSSHIKKPITNDFSKFVIVTQEKPSDDTDFIRKKLTKTWNYLISHKDKFLNRKSKIYRKSPLFGIFGIGEYSFSKYKVVISGFYKKPLFSLVFSDKPVIVDDTCYFLPFDDYDDAYCAMLLLNSEKIQNFLLSTAFLDNKRPYTAKILSRLDLSKASCIVPFEKLAETENLLGLQKYLTKKMYKRFSKLLALPKSTIPTREKEIFSSKLILG